MAEKRTGETRGSIEVLQHGRTLTLDYLAYQEWPEWVFHINGPDDTPLVIRRGDVFDALLQVREQWEPSGAKFLVNGARTDAWPSGMARDQGGGFAVYLMTLGRPASRDDLVDTFDPCAAELVTTVAEQREFSRRFFESFG